MLEPARAPRKRFRLRGGLRGREELPLEIRGRKRTREEEPLRLLTASRAQPLELPGTLEWLRSRGCQEAQGFLLARPLSPADLERQFLAPAQPTAEAETLARRSGRL